MDIFKGCSRAHRSARQILPAKLVFGLNVRDASDASGPWLMVSTGFLGKTNQILCFSFCLSFQFVQWRKWAGFSTDWNQTQTPFRIRTHRIRFLRCSGRIGAFKERPEFDSIHSIRTIVVIRPPCLNEWERNGLNRIRMRTRKPIRCRIVRTVSSPTKGSAIKVERVFSTSGLVITDHQVQNQFLKRLFLEIEPSNCKASRILIVKPS